MPSPSLSQFSSGLMRNSSVGRGGHGYARRREGEVVCVMHGA